MTIIFPHQLYKTHPAISKDRPIVLIEEYLYFNQYLFHKKKLVLHRASMQFYHDYLLEKGYQVTYIDAQHPLCDIRLFLTDVAQKGTKEIHYVHATDDWLDRRITAACEKNNIKCKVYDSPNFINTREEINTFFEGRKKYFQTDFYIHQRKTQQILLEVDNKPSGGKWTFDTENRARYPKNKQPPSIQFPSKNKYWEAAEKHIKQYYPNNYGGLSSTFIYPSTFEESEQWLDRFLQERFAEFGEFEDAIVRKSPILHHSVLTPMLNIGLLQPIDILEKAMNYARQHEIPLNSQEGFIRQILGWREFIRSVYQREGRQQRTQNYWKFTRKIPESFWTGKTGIPPLDELIKQTLETGYCHHIERLMVLGNFMLLCEFDPNEVYRWFMELFVDAYDWVMVPNVYGMTQFADGGLMTTKPYISGSNYLMKMSDYEKGEWQSIWDGLFWRFMNVHRGFFLQNPRLGMLVNMFDKMPKEKQNLHLLAAEKYLGTLDIIPN